MTESAYMREEYLQASLEYLRDATQLIFDLSGNHLQGRDEKLFIPLASCCNTAVGIYKLLYGSTDTEREAYMLMRALLERIVNLNYLRVADDLEVEKYFMHATYRMYHMTVRQQVGSKGTAVVKLNSDSRKRLYSDPEIQKALDLFSHTKPGLDWTDLSISKRIRYIGEKRSIKEEAFLIASLITYADASEVLHGSHYGDMFLTGIYAFGTYETTPTRQEVNHHISVSLGMPIVMLAQLLVATARVIAADHELDKYVETAKKLDKQAAPILRRMLSTGPQEQND